MNYLTTRLGNPSPKVKSYVPLPHFTDDLWSLLPLSALLLAANGSF